MKEEVKGEPGSWQAGVPRGRARPPRCCVRSRASELGRRFVGERLQPYQQGVRRQGDLVARVHLSDVAREPGPHHRGRPRLSGDGLRLRGRPSPPSRPTSRRQSASCSTDVARGRGARASSRQALELSLRMNPLTPDHHFYIDQGTNAYVRLVLVAIGRRLVEAGGARRSRGRDVPALQRASHADGEPGLPFDAKSARRRPPGRARTQRSPFGRPSGSERRQRVQLAFPYYTLWGFPEKFHRAQPEQTDLSPSGSRRSPGVDRGHCPSRRIPRRVRPGSGRARSSSAR